VSAPGLFVSSFTISRGLLRATQAALQEFGLQQMERFVLLTGVITGERALVRSAWVPLQFPETHDRGFSVTVPGEELRRLNREWVRKHEQLMIQVHSHPTFPYHSSTDDRYPMVTLEGGLSIVVPLFGFCSLTDLQSCAIYRLAQGEWHWLSPTEAGALVRVG
jgi:hypothetical protein